MTKPETARVRVSDPSELIDAVPYLLGFHPRESLVVIGIDASIRRRRAQLRQVRLAMRVDIPDSRARPGDFAELTQGLRRAAAGAAVCVWITDRATPQRDALLQDLSEVLAADLREAGLVVVDVLVASATRWWSMNCEDLRCCPPEGSRRQVGTSIFAAEATVAGLVALPERAAVEARLDGRPEPERHELLPMISAALARAAAGLGADPASRVTEFVAAAATARGCHLDDCRNADREGIDCAASGCQDPPQLSDSDLVSHAVGLRDIQLRDELWMLIDDGELDAEGLLQQLHRRLPAPYDAAALFLLGWSRWRAGDGTVAAMAAERALRSDERYSAAELLLATVRGGLDPRRTPRLSESMRAYGQ